MPQPTAKQIKTSGGMILNAPMAAGGPAVTARFGDVVCHPSGSGWHVCTALLGTSAVVPIGGLPAGQSTDQFRWSQGASYSGMGVPCTAAASQTYDQTTTGYGTDGRISGGPDGKPAF